MFLFLGQQFCANCGWLPTNRGLQVRMGKLVALAVCSISWLRLTVNGVWWVSTGRQAVDGKDALQVWRDWGRLCLVFILELFHGA